MTLTILIIHAAATWFMTGLIWFVQVNHYPLFSLIPPSAFGPYHAEHLKKTTLVVAAPMGLELLSGLYLLIARPSFFTFPEATLGIALLSIIWGSTVALQIPAHQKLGIQLELDVHRSLVLGNWIRTVAWSLRAILFGFVLHRALGGEV